MTEVETYNLCFYVNLVKVSTSPNLIVNITKEKLIFIVINNYILKLIHISKTIFNLLTCNNNVNGKLK